MTEIRVANSNDLSNGKTLNCKVLKSVCHKIAKVGNTDNFGNKTINFEEK